MKKWYIETLLELFQTKLKENKISVINLKEEPGYNYIIKSTPSLYSNLKNIDVLKLKLVNNIDLPDININITVNDNQVLFHTDPITVKIGSSLFNPFHIVNDYNKNAKGIKAVIVPEGIEMRCGFNFQTYVDSQETTLRYDVEFIVHKMEKIILLMIKDIYDMYVKGNI